MNDDARPDEVFEIEPSDNGGLLAHLPWWLILSAAFVVTELTAHPSIGVTVMCLKFGWNDFRTALWLRRRDPNRRRGAICSWFYFSCGLFRVCFWSFLLVLPIAFIVVATQALQAGPAAVPPNNDPKPSAEIGTCLIVSLISCAMFAFFTLASVWLARRGDVKVWISSSVSESRRRNQWPPRPIVWRRPEANMLRGLSFLAAIAAFVPSFIASIFVVSMLDVPNPGQLRNGAIWVPVSSMVALFVGAIFIVIIGNRWYKRSAAVSHGHCWPEESLSVVTEPSD